MYKSATEMRGVSQTREREREHGRRARGEVWWGRATHTRAEGGLGQGNEQGHTHTKERRETRQDCAEKQKQGFFVDGGGDGQNKYKECRSAIQEEARITCRVSNDQSARKVVICGGVGT